MKLLEHIKIIIIMITIALCNYMQIDILTECLPLDENLFSDLDEEEKQGHEVVSDRVNEFIINRAEHLESNAKEILQNSGYAGMFGIEEQFQTYTENRITEHSQSSCKIAENYSPDTSPGRGLYNAVENQINSYKVDNESAVKEDVEQIKETIISGLLQVVIDMGSIGTYQSHEDSMNDFQ
jgi:hypothetical protein